MLFIDDVEIFLLIAAIALCALLIIIELVDLAVFASYRKEYEKYLEEFSDDDFKEMTEDGDPDDL